MITDPTLRWIVTTLFAFGAAVCGAAVVRNRHRPADLISNSLHAVMAVAMAVMAWPAGAALPARAPMIFFLGAAAWFAVAALRTAGHRPLAVYHALMMLSMGWMYAAMGGLPLSPAKESAPSAMPGEGAAGHAGHGQHVSRVSSTSADAVSWTVTLNWLCTIGFAAAAAYWLFRLVTSRVRADGDGPQASVAILCQFAMAAGMATMFGAML